MSGYKVNLQKPAVFLYPGNEHTEPENEDRITFKIAQNEEEILKT